MVLPLLNDFKTTLGPRKERLGKSRVYVNFLIQLLKLQTYLEYINEDLPITAVLPPIVLRIV